MFSQIDIFSYANDTIQYNKDYLYRNDMLVCEDNQGKKTKNNIFVLPAEVSSVQL